jgi:hypothetical protein
LAKEQLYGEGFRVVLHGHKHVALIQEETVHLPGREDVDRMIVVSAPTMFDAGDRGFYVIDVAVCAESGEARMLITYYGFGGFKPKASEPVLLTIPPRKLSAARRIRIAEYINVHGDSRTDLSIHELPVPSKDHSTDAMGWTRDNATWVRHVPRAVDVPNATTPRPAVAAMCDGVTVDVVEGEDNQQGARTWGLRITADTTTTSASILERTRTAGSYAVSEAHQDRIFGSPLILPDMPIGCETVVHVVRDPAEVLEFSIHLPFAVDNDLKVEVRAYTEEPPDAELKRAAYLEPFAQVRVERYMPARRIRVWIDRPLMGVGYAVIWKLPLDDPSTLIRRGDPGDYQTAIHQADMLRASVLRAREDPQWRDRLYALLAPRIESLLRRLHAKGLVADLGAIEWALFAPDQPLPVAAQRGIRRTRPVLLPVVGTYGPSDPRWTEAKWPAGFGAIGRSYALNAVGRYMGPQSAYYRVKVEDPWNAMEVEAYHKVTGLQEHSVLFTVNALHPKRQEADVNWATLAIGAYGSDERFTLDVNLEDAGIASAGSGVSTEDSAHVVLTQELIGFGEDLWQAMSSHS